MVEQTEISKKRFLYIVSINDDTALFQSHWIPHICSHDNSSVFPIFRRSKLNAGSCFRCKGYRMVFKKCQLQLKRWVSVKFQLKIEKAIPYTLLLEVLGKSLINFSRDKNTRHICIIVSFFHLESDLFFIFNFSFVQFIFIKKTFTQFPFACMQHRNK